eukprot:gene21264-biopygen4137
MRAVGTKGTVPPSARTTCGKSGGPCSSSCKENGVSCVNARHLPALALALKFTYPACRSPFLRGQTSPSVFLPTCAAADRKPSLSAPPAGRTLVQSRKRKRWRAYKPALRRSPHWEKLWGGCRLDFTGDPRAIGVDSPSFTRHEKGTALRESERKRAACAQSARQREWLSFVIRACQEFLQISSACPASTLARGGGGTPCAMRAMGLVGPVRPVAPVAPVRPHPPVRSSNGTCCCSWAAGADRREARISALESVSQTRKSRLPTPRLWTVPAAVDRPPRSLRAPLWLKNQFISRTPCIPSAVPSVVVAAGGGGDTSGGHQRTSPVLVPRARRGRAAPSAAARRRGSLLMHDGPARLWKRSESNLPKEMLDYTQTAMDADWPELANPPSPSSPGDSGETLCEVPRLRPHASKGSRASAHMHQKAPAPPPTCIKSLPRLRPLVSAGEPGLPIIPGILRDSLKSHSDFSHFYLRHPTVPRRRPKDPKRLREPFLSPRGAAGRPERPAQQNVVLTPTPVRTNKENGAPSPASGILYFICALPDALPLSSDYQGCVCRCPVEGALLQRQKSADSVRGND